MKSLYVLGSLGFAALVSGYGCSVSVKEVGPSSAGSGGKTASSSVSIASTGTMMTSSTGAGGSGCPDAPPRGADCAHAIELMKGTNMSLTFMAAQGKLGEAEQKDYFKFTAKKGEWLNLRTEANPDDDPMMVDTVLTLWSADGKTQIAEADDGYPRLSTPDANMDVLIPADGTYCLEVQEFSTWQMMNSKSDCSFDYTVAAITLDAANQMALGNDYNLDTGMNDTLAMPQTVSNLFTAQNGQQIANIYGAIEPQTDIDVFKVTTPTGAKVMSLNFEPPGPKGMGSTGGIGKINIFLANGMTPYAQLDFNDATGVYQPGSSYGFDGVPVSEKTAYVIQINNNSMAGGATPSYFFKYATGDATNPQEANDTLNNVSATAEATMETPNMDDPKITQRFIGGTIPPGDKDFWKINANMGDTLTLACSSRRAGAGVADFAVDLYKDPTQAALQSDVETAKTDLLWADKATFENATKAPVKIATSGVYYVRLSSTSMVPNGATGTYYLCGIRTIAP
jgi:hypothetical protein